MLIKIKRSVALEDENNKGKPFSGYQNMVKAEIPFARATGYDKEKTAVVPLSDLARREEDRLRKKDWNKRLVPEKKEVFLDDDQVEVPVGEIIHVLRAAKTVEEVAGVLVEIVVNLIPRVLLLWERKEMVYGFASRGMGLEEVKLLTIEMPRQILRELTGKNVVLESFQGAPRMVESVQRFFKIIGGNPPEILLIPIFVTPEDRWFLYADNYNKFLPKLESRLLEVVASRAGARADLLLDGQSW
jgi:hypothetical protein